MPPTEALVEKFDRRMIAGDGDVRDRASLARVLDEGMNEFGRLDFVLANAGIMPCSGEHAHEFRAWKDSIDVLLTGDAQLSS